MRNAFENSVMWLLGLWFLCALALSVGLSKDPLRDNKQRKHLRVLALPSTLLGSYMQNVQICPDKQGRVVYSHPKAHKRLKGTGTPIIDFIFG